MGVVHKKLMHSVRTECIWLDGRVGRAQGESGGAYRRPCTTCNAVWTGGWVGAQRRGMRPCHGCQFCQRKLEPSGSCQNLFPNSTNPSGPSCKKQTCDAHSPKPVVLQVQMLPLRCGARPRKRRNPHETEDSTPSGDTDETKLGVPKRAKEVKSTLSPGLKSASGRTCDSADSAGQGGEDNEDCVRDNDGRASGGSVQATRTLRKCIVGMGCDNLTVCYLRMRW